jgi:hypothetical protein
MGRVLQIIIIVIIIIIRPSRETQFFRTQKNETNESPIVIIKRLYFVNWCLNAAMKKAIRRFRVRFPGGFSMTCWPNGKASDYEILFSIFLFLTQFYQWVSYVVFGCFVRPVGTTDQIICHDAPAKMMASMSQSYTTQKHFIFYVCMGTTNSLHKEFGNQISHKKCIVLSSNNKCES